MKLLLQALNTPLRRRDFFVRFGLGIPAVFWPFGHANARPDRQADHRNGARQYHHHTKPPEPLENELAQWQAHPRVPVLEATYWVDALLIEAVRRNEPIYARFRQYDGKTLIRRLTPLGLFRVEPRDYEDVLHPDQWMTIERRAPYGSVYIQTWDHDHAAARTFRTERLEPLPTAPWMHLHFKPRSESEWQSQRQSTDRLLSENKIEPIPQSNRGPVQV